jgi:transcriptional regulator with XRE-family HTH domain
VAFLWTDGNPRYFQDMVYIPSSMRTRSIGEELIGLRKAAGYSGVQMARKLGWENSRVNRIEHGKYNTSEVDVTQWVTILGHPRTVLDDLLTMLRQSNDGFVVQPHGQRLPDQLHSLIRHETKAQVIQNVQLMVVPGLLQTRGYAEALIRGEGLADEDMVQARVQARIDRQCMFNRPRQPDCTFYIHEFALRLVVGDRKVMNDQVMHLALMANSHGVAIRIIPAWLGVPPGLVGSFMRLDYAADDHLPIVYIEHAGTSLFIDEEQVLETHAELLNRLDRLALDRGQSRLWLVNLASEYDRPGDDPHALGLPYLA